MKKIISVIFLMLALLLSFSLNAFAIGNDWTFNSNYFSVAMANSTNYFGYTSDNGSVSKVSTSEYRVRFNGVEITYPLVGGIYKGTASNGSFNESYYVVDYMSFNIPMVFTVPAGETVTFQFYIQGYVRGAYNPYVDIESVSAGLKLNSNNNTIILSDIQYNKVSCDSEIGKQVVDLTGQQTGFEVIEAGEGFLFTIKYNNNSSYDRKFKSFHFNVTLDNNTFYSANESDNQHFLYYGFFAEKESNTILPSYVEENLISIGNEIKTTNEKLQTLISQIEELQKQLEEIKNEMGGNSSTTNNYYNQIVNPSPEQTAKQQELQQMLDTAKEELAEMQKTMGTVTVPTASDISSATSYDTQVSIDNALNNEDVNGILSLFFDNSLILTMLLSVISIATVGYVLHGKTG